MVITGNYLVITFEVITFSFTTQPYKIESMACTKWLKGVPTAIS